MGENGGSDIDKKKTLPHHSECYSPQIRYPRSSRNGDCSASLRPPCWPLPITSSFPSVRIAATLVPGRPIGIRFAARAHRDDEGEAMVS